MAMIQKRTKHEGKEKVEILIVNADELVTLAGGSQKPRTGKQMQELGIILRRRASS